MKPIIFTIPGINWHVPGYGLMLMLGLFISIWWAARRAARSGANPDVILNMGFIAIIAGVVGCRIMYVVHYWDTFKTAGNTLQVIWAIIDVSKGGLEFYGGFILTTITVLAWLHFKEKVSIRWYLDIVAPSAALGLAIGRIGCFLNGCCFGGTCDLPWAVRFPFGSNACIHQWKKDLPGAGIREELLYTDPSTGVTMTLTRESFFAPDAKLEEVANTYRTMNKITQKLEKTTDAAERQRLSGQLRALTQSGGKDLIQYLPVAHNMVKYGLSAAQIRALARDYRTLPVHPTEPYSTITALIIAFFLDALYWRRTRDGQVILTLLLIQPVMRWWLEVIRVDNPVDTIHMFTISQFLAVAMTIVALVGLIVLHFMPPRSPRARLWEPDDQPPAPKGGKRNQVASAR